ncbi:spore coat protein CotJB [Aceticella autotrophica]|uniref:Spore coat protein CotJB n=1 Tax=Aceticella autotrophica TaxID=2755338 RepID=A0A975AX61_9THEO|nr:spore coat protein CotJB [Aceticella autotrophica]QSZ28094.1 spore coat protein CotJB [Aceticella autotrophica]
MDAKAKMLRKLMEIEFACVDLNLYLDTHPSEEKALQSYNYYSEQLKTLKTQYEQVYGPLMAFGQSASQYPWKWIDEPWPWEIQY